MTSQDPRDYEADLLRLVDSFTGREVDFHTFVKRFDQSYVMDPAKVVSADAEAFWWEVEEQLFFTGDFGEIEIDDFREWLARQRQHYPALDESDMPQRYPLRSSATETDN